MADCLTTIPIEEPATCSVDLLSNIVTANDRTVLLTAMRAEIMAVLIDAHPRPARAAFIAERIGGQGEEPTIPCIQAQICNMRPKLAEIGVDLQTLGNCRYGYEICDPLDMPLFTEADAKVVRQAIRILLRARRLI